MVESHTRKGKTVPVTYDADPFRVLRAALVQLCEEAIYLERESEYGPERGCPDYLAMLGETLRALMTAQTFADLAGIEWLAGKAALAMDSGV
jgi:hypothetical protein